MSHDESVIGVLENDATTQKVMKTHDTLETTKVMKTHDISKINKKVMQTHDTLENQHTK